MTLTKYEKETIILFNEGEDTAHIQTYNAGLRKRLAAFSKKHPDLCRLEKSFAQGGVIYVLESPDCLSDCKHRTARNAGGKPARPQGKPGSRAGRNNVTVRGRYAVKMSGLHPMF